MITEINKELISSNTGRPRQFNLKTMNISLTYHTRLEYYGTLTKRLQLTLVKYICILLSGRFFNRYANNIALILYDHTFTLHLNDKPTSRDAHNDINIKAIKYLLRRTK